MQFVLFLQIILCFTSLQLSGQEKSENALVVVFYNVENLFDSQNNPETNDDEFTPAGDRHWTKTLLDQKVKNLYRAILSAGKGRYPDIIGLAEIENLWVIEYMIKKSPLNKIPYGIIHKESPDPRGIDVALLYRKDRIEPIDYRHIAITGNSEISISSRDILHFTGSVNKTKIHFFVNHWPSRSSGYMESKDKRDFAAKILKNYIDSLQKQEPDAQILLMGDFNATPKENCFTEILEATLNRKSLQSQQLLNLSSSWIKEGKGTIRSGGQWEIFDQFICTGNFLLDGKFKLLPDRTLICEEPFLLEPENKFLGYKPFRTYLGPAYHGGTSDHLPIATEIVIKQ
jgi:exonuclease III